MAARAAGDDEAMEIDEDYLRCMEHGMPPMSGWGMGIDRFVCLLSGPGEPARRRALPADEAARTSPRPSRPRCRSAVGADRPARRPSSASARCSASRRASRPTCSEGFAVLGYPVDDVDDVGIPPAARARAVRRVGDDAVAASPDGDDVRRDGGAREAVRPQRGGVAHDRPAPQPGLRPREGARAPLPGGGRGAREGGHAPGRDPRDRRPQRRRPRPHRHSLHLVPRPRALVRGGGRRPRPRDEPGAAEQGREGRQGVERRSSATRTRASRRPSSGR